VYLLWNAVENTCIVALDLGSGNSCKEFPGEFNVFFILDMKKG
jgi:hypothetical protein